MGGNPIPLWGQCKEPTGSTKANSRIRAARTVEPPQYTNSPAAAKRAPGVANILPMTDSIVRREMPPAESAENDKLYVDQLRLVASRSLS